MPACASQMLGLQACATIALPAHEFERGQIKYLKQGRKGRKDRNVL